ncbi:LolA family protein [Persephonella sp.]
MLRTLLAFIFLFSYSYGSVLDSLEEKVKEYQSIQSKFVQKTFMKGLQEPETFEGKLFITKPEKIKILYEKPIKQVYFMEGKKLIIYTPEEKQVIKTEVSDQFILIKIFRAFSENGGLKKLFKLEKEVEKGRYIDAVLSVKESTDIKKVEMILKKDSFAVEQIIVWDSEGNKIVLSFYDFEYKKEPLKLYINIPDNVEIINY